MAKVIRISTAEDKKAVFDYLQYRTYPDNFSDLQKRGLRRKCKNLILENNTIKFVRSNNQKILVVCAFERESINDILAAEHEDSHYGIVKMVSMINQKYYGIPKQFIIDYVNSCEACRNFTPLRTVSDLNLVPITQKYDRYVIDCVDLRRYAEHNDGFSWILNVVDSFTKFVWSYKLKAKSAEHVTNALQSCFYNFGVPLSIQADNGKEFCNQTLKNLCRSMNIQIIHGRPRNPKAQGMVERVNQTIKRWLARFLFTNNCLTWIGYLEKIVYKYNISIHQATRKSPFQLFFGRLGYNIPGLEPEIQEAVNSSELENENSDNIRPWALEDDLESQNTNEMQIAFEESIGSAMVPDNVQILESDQNQDRIEALESFAKYSQRTIRNANSNLMSRNINIGDTVKIAKDFDNNTLTRRHPFDSFFEEFDFKVVNILQNNMFVIANVSLPNDIRTVFKGRLKKINK